MIAVTSETARRTAFYERGHYGASALIPYIRYGPGNPRPFVNAAEPTQGTSHTEQTWRGNDESTISQTKSRLHRFGLESHRIRWSCDLSARNLFVLDCGANQVTEVPADSSSQKTAASDLLAPAAMAADSAGSDSKPTKEKTHGK